LDALCRLALIRQVYIHGELISATSLQPNQRCRLAGEEVVDGLSCNPYYKSVSTEDDWESELWPEEDDESELLVDDEDGSTTRGASESSTLVGGDAGGPLNKKSQFRHRSATTPGAHVTAAEPSEPLMTSRATKRVNDAVAVDHPFGCDRQGRESSSLLLVSS
jgi:hypothetical protein